MEDQVKLQFEIWWASGDEDEDDPDDKPTLRDRAAFRAGFVAGQAAAPRMQHGPYMCGDRDVCTPETHAQHWLPIPR